MATISSFRSRPRQRGGLPRASAPRITGHEFFESDSLPAARLSEIFDSIYEVYRATMYGHTREQFEQHLLADGNLHLALYYGSGGEIAGFAFVGIQCVEHDGKTVAAFSGGGFFRPGYRDCGVPTMRYCLREALRFKLRHPGVPLGYLARTSSPVAYHLFVRTLPLVYPSPARPTPPGIDALVRKLSASRGYSFIGDDTWIVRSDAIPRDASRMRRLEGHPNVRYYCALNPNYSVGEALLVWMPLGAATIAGGIFRQLRLLVRR
ncbi:hypothetical protein [Mycobacterium kiyosense]|uniref:Uncharacterized protein n=1 Tax=Mycobacterium kiyosense TaxID=2871094 RepID=A0AA37PSI8_9MYCO|nr:hypothetical protein [Mycobacterium kiyosense]BDB42473.1 hypothetical protein IWGMT90018_29190 [Mycobacterium kiyosense]GLB81520.1 hypothetical protein SRL2020028_07760 [Mycobacterium kiyosense]GLB90117.1 hypothetical protein SRL2020130_29340 [Mycobacterium kiyosense]GLB93713.1 hypothetical protein SRL2020226_04890 [Mycobacterium kiyosense]GLC00147.1 hypothetical protein SRL2020400_07380 [Mycobacterium kiyosense]